MCVLQRFSTWWLAVPAALLLQGCVESQRPLLEEDSAVAVPAFTGRYRVPIRDNSPQVWAVRLDDKTYTLELPQVPGGGTAIGTLHTWRGGAYLAQLFDRETHKYTYMIVKKTKTGAELNLIPCPAHCSITSKGRLLELAWSAEQDRSNKEIFQAERIGGDNPPALAGEGDRAKGR